MHFIYELSKLLNSNDKACKLASYAVKHNFDCDFVIFDARKYQQLNKEESCHE